MKECDFSGERISYLASQVDERFFQRRDLYSRQLNDGRYICIHKSLGMNHIISHLNGDITLGTYLLDIKNRARFIVFDADDEESMDGLITTSRNLQLRDIPSYLEDSRRGGHLWLFFSSPISGKKARKFGAGIQKAYGLDNLELFPKQDRLG